ncbi:hypothetical protein P7K49_023606 [Saguinus oedipus]|uniref:Uncharacterized protein n=1 Tax=Saguinus oedipus TaxID=9490 RepID=A0ABQ9UMW9_SAGOE|nr:hypothetical protein P7K49_023606 [Saguinus oedipus]
MVPHSSHHTGLSGQLETPTYSQPQIKCTGSTQHACIGGQGQAHLDGCAISNKVNSYQKWNPFSKAEAAASGSPGVSECGDHQYSHAMKQQ